MAVVNIIYHQFPHYRSPVMRELVLHGKHEYKFWGSHKELSGIIPFTGDEVVKVNELELKTLGKFQILNKYWVAIFDKECDAIIILCNPNMLATWYMPIVARLLGKKVLFWGHGWLKKESFIKRSFRKLYFSLSHHMLVYGERAKRIGSELGYNENKITTIYNSLNYTLSTQILTNIAHSPLKDSDNPRLLFENPSDPLIICTARITKLCRFEILFNAAAELLMNGKPVNILLVGNGPEVESLKKVAEQLKLSVNFYGACYDEAILANFIYHSDLTVSPGKIGLTAIHSLTYGTPAITHGNFDEQMPEFEAIIPKVSGDFFEQGNYLDLTEKINDWLENNPDRDAVRQSCMDVVGDKWNPESQRKLIDGAVSHILAME